MTSAVLPSNHVQDSGVLPCPVCGSEHQQVLHASPASKDHYAKAAGLSSDTLITSYFCRDCGAIVNAPRFLGQLAKNVYEGELAVHPHGWFNFRDIFDVSWSGIFRPAVAKKVVRALLRHLTGGRGARYGLSASLRSVMKGGSLPLNLRVDQDFAILRALLRQGGDPLFQPRSVLTVGCPLMAFIPLALRRHFNAQLSYFVAFYENYWGKACQINGTDCLRSCQVLSGSVRIDRWDALGQYDFIYLAQCLDHVYDIPSCMQKLAGHLKPGGLICVENHSFFENKERFGRFASQHSVVFTRRSWRNLLSRLGYEELGIMLGKSEFYSLLRVGGAAGRLEEPSVEDYAAVRSKLYP